MRRTLLPLLTLCFLALTGCGTRYSVVSDPAARPHDVPAAPVAVALQTVTTDGGALPRVSGSSFVSALGQALRGTEAFSSVSLPGESIPAGARIVEVRSTAVMDNRSGSNMGKGVLVMLSLGLAAPFVEQSFGQTLSAEATLGQRTVLARTTGEMYCGAFQVTDVRTGLTAKVEASGAASLASQIVTLVYGEAR
jgi:hypothetical protein